MHGKAAHTMQSGLERFFSMKDAPAKKQDKSSSMSLSWKKKKSRARLTLPLKVVKDTNVVKTTEA